MSIIMQIQVIGKGTYGIINCKTVLFRTMCFLFINFILLQNVNITRTSLTEFYKKDAQKCNLKSTPFRNTDIYCFFVYFILLKKVLFTSLLKCQKIPITICTVMGLFLYNILFLIRKGKRFIIGLLHFHPLFHIIFYDIKRSRTCA